MDGDQRIRALLDPEAVADSLPEVEVNAGLALGRKGDIGFPVQDDRGLAVSLRGEERTEGEQSIQKQLDSGQDGLPYSTWSQC
jgi:hypothetical protein